MQRDHTILIKTLENRESKSITSGYGYANFLYVAFFCWCFGEELKVDKGIVSYLKHISCSLFYGNMVTLPAKCKKHVRKCYENIDEYDERKERI